MTYEEFWEGDVSLPKFYRQAEKIRLKRKQEDDNFHCWLQGLYNYEAFATALANAFRKKNAKPVEYLEKPIQFLEKDEEDTPEKIQKKRENESIKFKLQMNNWAKMFDHLPKD